MNINNIVKVKPISTVIDFQSQDKTLIDGYIVLEKTGEYFLRILEGFTKQRDDRTTEKEGSIVPNRVGRCHKISGTYGVGKSYFLLMLRVLLESLGDRELYEEMVEKFSNFPSILYHLDILKKQEKDYIIIDLNGKDFVELDFKSTIEREVHKKLLEKIGEENLTFNTFYEKTVKVLTQWQKESSPMYEIFRSSFIQEIDFTYEEMIEALKQRDRIAKEAYIKVYRQTMNEGVKDSFNTLGEFLDEADNIAKENSYAGIVIIFDEFSSYLRGRAEKGLLSIDLASIDILTERTLVQNARQIHFITSEHEDIERILEENLSNLETVKKTSGRFKDYKVYFDRGSKLVQNVMEIEQKKLEKLKFDNQNIFKEYNQNSYAYRLEEVYPLNPFTLEYLVRVSEKYAQGDRTLFTFMDEDFRKFVEREQVYDGSKLNLLGVDGIVDSFEEVILDDKKEFARAYNIQMQRTNNRLERRLVKALALDYAISITDVGRMGVGINNSNLKHILSLTDKELESIKEYLKRETNDAQSYIIFNTGANGYELSPDTAGINIEEEIRKELSSTNEKRFFQNLLLSRSNALDIKTDYTLVRGSRRFPFDRKVEGQFINSLGDLRTIDIQEEMRKIIGDGKIFYFIPPAGQNYDFNRTLEVAKDKVEEMTDYRVALAIPKKFTFASGDEKLLKRYEAVERLTKNEKIMNAPKAQNQIRLEIVKLRNEIYSKLGSFARTENFIFLFKDQNLENIKSTEALLAWWMVEKLYPKFPIVNVENFVDRGSSTPLIENLIIPRKAEAVDINSGRVFNKQIRETMKALDLVKLTPTTQDYKVEIKYPNEARTKEIFNVFEIPEEKLSLKGKYLKLTASPYGLNDAIFETLFATFLMLTNRYFLENKNSERVELTSETIKNVWDNCNLAEIRDALPYIVKLDLINILETIDKNISQNSSYRKLRATAPSDNFGQTDHMRIMDDYIKDFAKEIEIFMTNLKHLPRSMILKDKMDDLYKVLISLTGPKRPDNKINKISQLIDRFFDNGIELREEDNKININRYTKLQNFIDNMFWLKKNIGSMGRYSDIIARLKSNIAGVPTGTGGHNVAKVEKELEEALHYIYTGDSWRNSKYKNYISVQALETSVNQIIEDYNDSYEFNHRMLESTKDELRDSIKNYEFNSFIKVLEKIKFQDLDSLEEIQKEARDLGACDNQLNKAGGEILECSNCGNLSEIFWEKNRIENQKNDTIKKLGKLMNLYRVKIENLNVRAEVKRLYDREETIVEFIRRQRPQDTSKIEEMVVIVRDDWWENTNKTENLVEALYPLINEFIEMSQAGRLNKIHFSDVIKSINTNIELSGFKHISFEQFESEVIKEINRLKQDYDVINISE